MGDDNKYVFVPGSDQSASKSTEIELFPFLSFPIEIRLLCYQYLVPDIVVPSHPVPSRFYTPETSTSIREDQETCTPGILSVSKQLQHEVINEFYGRARFELTIIKRGYVSFDFLGYGYYLNDHSLPHNYYLIRNLNLTIRIKGSPNDNAGEQLSRIYRQIFLHERQSALETVHIEIVDQGFWPEHLEHPTRLETTIKRYLGPLRTVRGLKVVTVQTMGLPDEWAMSRVDTPVAVFRRDTILSELQTALDELQHLMVLPTQQPPPDQSI